MEKIPVFNLTLVWNLLEVNQSGFGDEVEVTTTYEVEVTTENGKERFLYSSSLPERRWRERDAGFMRYILDDAETVFGGHAEPNVNSICDWLIEEGICDEYDNTQQRAERILENYNNLNRLMSTEDQKNLLWALRLMGF